MFLLLSMFPLPSTILDDQSILNFDIKPTPHNNHFQLASLLLSLTEEVHHVN